MNLNFHLVALDAVDDTAPLNLEESAYAALVDAGQDEEGLMAMAELVDWELASLGSLTGLGLRCERALRQRLLHVENGQTLERMANKSGTVGALFQELTRYAESLGAPACLVA